jgi:hypothetical protein
VPLVRGSLPRRPRPAAAAGQTLCTELRTVLTTAARWDAFLSLSSALGLRSASAGAASASSAIATGPRGVPRQCRVEETVGPPTANTARRPGGTLEFI